MLLYEIPSTPVRLYVVSGWVVDQYHLPAGALGHLVSFGLLAARKKNNVRAFNLSASDRNTYSRPVADVDLRQNDAAIPAASFANYCMGAATIGTEQLRRFLYHPRQCCRRCSAPHS